jgi:hypothetical protein
MNTAKRRLQSTGGLLVVLVALALPIQALAGAQVPLKGSDIGGFTFPATCDSGAALVVDIDGTGNATHVGRYAYSALECFNPDTLLYRGEFRITAANGDTVHGTYSGEVVDIVGTVGLYEQDAVITGGTGRFAGASGEFHVSGEADLATGNYSQELTGSVSSAGSAKK